MRVIGIDPSSQSTGFGVIEYDETACRVLDYGTIKPRHRLLHLKINEIRLRLEVILKSYAPEEAAIESLFYAQNIKTAITLGQVRGALLVAVASHKCELFEYSALEIKKAVTGYGQAEKNQVAIMIKVLLNIQDDHLETDASDALAAAYCHLNSRLFQKKLEDSGARKS